MKMTQFHVTNYRSVRDSSVVDVDPDVTCLVGKNESGKTAVLQALWRLNPDDQSAIFDTTADYPRVGLNKYQRSHDKEPAKVIDAQFELNPEELRSIEAILGTGVLRSPLVSISRDFKNILTIRAETDEKRYVNHLVASSETDEKLSSALAGVETIDELLERLDRLAAPAPTESSESDSVAAIPAASISKLKKSIKAAKPLTEQVDTSIRHILPQFLYFGEYDIMQGAASLEVLSGSKDSSNAGLRTLYALLELADTSPRQLQAGAVSYEEHKARLESTANSITDEVFAFWSQNRDLEVEFDVAPASPKDRGYIAPAQNQQVPNWLRVRVKNRRHRVTVPFDERSKGFVWFFSFLVRFNQIARQERRVILLLDEPGLSLHASAQSDFLRFINERLADEGHQVIYTTHSPFMIEPDRLHRVRTVEDVIQQGTVVSAESLRTDDATSFPLQAALGYSMAQSLFLGPHCLLVEGPSDLIYLQQFSALAAQADLEALDERWVIVPVGGADRLAAFCSLLGANRINVVVLMDFESKDTQRVDRLIQNSVLEKNCVMNVAQFTDNPHRPADIEDLLGASLYLRLVNAAYNIEPPLVEGDLKQGTRITKRLQAACKARNIAYNHFRPAQSAISSLSIETVHRETLERFSTLFQSINSHLVRGN